MKTEIGHVDNIVIGGVDSRDYPDFADAYVESADVDGREATEDECVWLTENYPEVVNEMAFESLIP